MGNFTYERKGFFRLIHISTCMWNISLYSFIFHVDTCAKPMFPRKKNLVWNLIQIEEFPKWRNGCSYISPWTSLAYKKPVTLECFFLEYLEVKSRGDSTREATKRETPRRWRARHNTQEATGRPDNMSLFVVYTYLPLHRLSSLGQDGICEIWSKLRQKISFFLCIWTLMQVINQQTRVQTWAILLGGVLVLGDIGVLLKIGIGIGYC